MNLCVTEASADQGISKGFSEEEPSVDGSVISGNDTDIDEFETITASSILEEMDEESKNEMKNLKAGVLLGGIACFVILTGLCVFTNIV
jgi:hypothetical protein